MTTEEQAAAAAAEAAKNNPPAPPAPGTEPPATPPEPPAEPPTPPAEGDPPAEPTEQTPEQVWETIGEELGIQPEQLQTWLAEVEDPLSPQAIVAYSKNFAQTVQQDYDAWLRAEDPRAYAYRLHRRNGGTDEEFLNPSISNLPDRTVLETSVDSQRKFFVKSLATKGIEGEEADAVLEAVIKSGKLKDRVLTIYDQDKANEDKNIEDYRAAIAAADAQMASRYNSTMERVTQSIAKGDKLKIHIPEASRGDFNTFVREKVVADETGAFFINLPVEPDSEQFANLLQGLYFMFSNGDVTKLKPKEAIQKPGLRFGGQGRQPIVPPVKPTPEPPRPRTIEQIFNRS